MSESSEQVVELSHAEMLDFTSKGDARLREIEGQFQVRIIPRGNTLKVMGDDDAEVARAAEFIEGLVSFSRGNSTLDKRQMRVAMEGLRTEGREQMEKVFADRVDVSTRKSSVVPMTPTQKKYLDSIRNHDIVFGVGPAGTGKTYLAMAMAVHYLTTSAVRRIVLVRPAVEAGEKLGFLPGDIMAKFDPYVRPLYDALHDMMPAEKVRVLLENNIVEVAPLAFMRGRTLNSSFVILDEGQNTSIEQMKMFLTRLGYDSKAVITGDITQTDLPQGKESGLVNVKRVLHGIEGIDFVYFDQKDVVRHELVQKIIRAYEKVESARQTELPLPDVSDDAVAAAAAAASDGGNPDGQ